MTAIDFAEHRLTSQLVRSLNDHRCGRCLGLWRDHGEDERFACLIELERLRDEARRDVRPLHHTKPDRALEARKRLRDVLVATGRFGETEADLAALEQLRAIEELL